MRAAVAGKYVSLSVHICLRVCLCVGVSERLEDLQLLAEMCSGAATVKKRHCEVAPFKWLHHPRAPLPSVPLTASSSDDDHYHNDDDSDGFNHNNTDNHDYERTELQRHQQRRRQRAHSLKNLTREHQQHPEQALHEDK